MGIIVPFAAALIATSAPSATLAVRFDAGMSATATISARIVRASAAVGPGRAPPAPNMVPRHATVTAADGRTVPALIYDFE